MKKLMLMLVLGVMTLVFLGGEKVEGRATVDDPLEAEIEFDIVNSLNQESMESLETEWGNQIVEVTDLDKDGWTRKVVQVTFNRLQVIWEKVVAKYGLMALVVMLVLGGVKIVMAAGSEEDFKDGMTIVKWSVLGMVALVIPYGLIEFFVRMSGTANRLGESETGSFVNQPLDSLLGSVLDIALGLIGIIAILVILVGAFYWVFSMGDVEKAKKGINAIKHSAVGLLLATFAYTIVRIGSDIAFKGDGLLEQKFLEPDLYVQIATTIMYILGPAALVAIMIAGYVAMISEDADHIQKAKRIVMYAAGGLVLAFLSYAIVELVVTVDLKGGETL